MKISSSSIDDKTHRLTDETGLTVGYAVNLCADGWLLTDAARKHLTLRHFKSPDDARESMQRRVGVHGTPRTPTETAMVKRLTERGKST